MTNQEHRWADDFDELLQALADDEGVYYRAGAVLNMAIHIDDKDVDATHPAFKTLGRMMDLFEPALEEYVDDDDMDFPTSNDDLAFSRCAFYDYEAHGLEQDIGVLAQCIWGVELPPENENSSYVEELIDAIQRERLRQQISSALNIESVSKRKGHSDAVGLAVNEQAPALKRRRAM